MRLQPVRCADSGRRRGREAAAEHQANRERGNGQVRRVGFRIVAGLVSDQHPDATFAGAPCQ